MDSTNRRVYYLRGVTYIKWGQSQHAIEPLETYLASDYTVNHLGLDQALRGNVRVRYYDAGHMMYIHKPSREQLTHDVAEFYRWTLDGPSPKAPASDATNGPR